MADSENNCFYVHPYLKAITYCNWEVECLRESQFRKCFPSQRNIIETQLPLYFYI